MSDEKKRTSDDPPSDPVTTLSVVRHEQYERQRTETPIHCAECSGYNTRTYKRDGRSYVYCSSCNEESERLGVPPPEQRRPTARSVGRVDEEEHRREVDKLVGEGGEAAAVVVEDGSPPLGRSPLNVAGEVERDRVPVRSEVAHTPSIEGDEETRKRNRQRQGECWVCGAELTNETGWTLSHPSRTKLECPDPANHLGRQRRESDRPAVVWADDASPFTGPQVKALLDENEMLRKKVGVPPTCTCGAPRGTDHGILCPAGHSDDPDDPDDPVAVAAPGPCTPTSDWGCEARKKLGIARGALDAIAREDEDLIEAKNHALDAFHETVMLELCQKSTPQQAVERAGEIVQRFGDANDLRTEQVELVDGAWVVVISYLREVAERPPITHVAIRFQDKIWSLPRPYRHHHVIRMIVYLDPDVKHVDAHGDDQGFLDSTGRYLTRGQAEVSAQLNKQIKNDKIIGGVLTSEDLW